MRVEFLDAPPEKVVGLCDDAAVYEALCCLLHSSSSSVPLYRTCRQPPWYAIAEKRPARATKHTGRVLCGCSVPRRVSKRAKILAVLIELSRSPMKYLKVETLSFPRGARIARQTCRHCNCRHAAGLLGSLQRAFAGAVRWLTKSPSSYLLVG